MAPSGPLQATYQEYLTSGCNQKHAASLVNELSNSGLAAEADGLSHYLAKSDAVFVSQEGPWRGCSCSVEWTPPKEPRAGDLWFDVVELTTAVFVAELPGISADIRGWMATRPVQGWQFETFLRVAKPTSRSASDRFGANRFSEIDQLAPVTDLCPYEAEAYASWFGKWSVGGLDLKCAESVLSLERRQMLSPDGLLLWDLSPPISGWNYAVGFQPETGEFLEEEFFDCDRDPKVGFATYVALRSSSRVNGWRMS
jgi:hypothetical protein